MLEIIRIIRLTKLIKRNKKYIKATALIALIACSVYLFNSGITDALKQKIESVFGQVVSTTDYSGNLSQNGIPEYNGKAYTTLNNNVTDLGSDTKVYYQYSKLDKYKRSGIATACIDYDCLNFDERGDISKIRPSGWQTIKADVDGGWLYNRCHLIASCLGGPCGRKGESKKDLKRNLITGTRSFNLTMLTFEKKIVEYIEETHNHVLYSVEPVYNNKDLVASGVILKAKSVEDNKLEFNVYIYNIEDGYSINYRTGKLKK